MLQSLKKSSDKSSGAMLPAWHPNFRNFEQLPDIKVVRTTFFVNGVAILFASVLLIYVVYREVELATLKSDTAAAKKYVDANKEASDQSVALYRKFQAEEKKVKELQQFLAGSPITVTDFLLELGGSLPETVKLSNADYRASGVTIRGGIQASSEEGAGIAVKYVEALKKNPYFAKLFSSIKLISILRDPGTGQIRFEIALDFKAPVNAKK
jgi:hypothetical protein